METDLRIKTSKFQPGVTGSDNCFNKGDKAHYRASDDTIHVVGIDSEMQKHDNAPRDGLVYECLLDEQLSAKAGLSRCALPADKLTPILKS